MDSFEVKRKMTMPTKEAVYAESLRLWKNDLYKRGYDELGQNNPTEQELKESGVWSAAISQLMRDTPKTECAEWKSYNENLENFSDLKLDVQEALASGIYTCGTRNTGKSDLNMIIADIMRNNDVTVLVFDPSCDWLKRSGIQKYLTVQPFTPIAIPTESMIYDLSLLTSPEQKSYVERFNRTLFEHQISNGEQWYFCIYEEAHQYFPQGCLRARAFQYSVRLLTQGRNFRISMALITQFSSMLDKDTLKFMQQRFFGASNEPNDLRYLHGFLGKDAEQLKTLDNGSFLYFNKGKISKVGIEPYESEVCKTQIQIPEVRPIQPTKPKQETNIVTFLRLGMIVLFIALLFGVSR